MIFILFTAYFLGMAAAIPMGPVGSVLLRVPQNKWYWCLAAILALDLVIAALALMSLHSFLAVSAAPSAKVISGIFLMGFAVRGLVKQRKQKKLLAPAKQRASITKVVSLAMANPGTYLMVASAFIFLDMSALVGFWEKWFALAAVSLGAVSWYHFVRVIFTRQSAKFQIRFERGLFYIIAAAGGFTFISGLLAIAI